jgi:acetyltransferase-like isoleucine patch superfamily enzyme
MGLGIAKILIRCNVFLNIHLFAVRKKVLGFENACAFLIRLDKNSMIPVLKRNGAKIGNVCDIEAPLFFHNCNDFSNLIVGNNCHIGKNCFFDLRGKITIEDNVVISMLTAFITHQDINKSELRYIYPASQEDILIKNNSYIGIRSTILKGVVVNPYSIVAAGSVVLKNVESFTIVGGIPANIIKKIKQ